jgi:hypothetical protein
MFVVVKDNSVESNVVNLTHFQDLQKIVNT